MDDITNQWVPHSSARNKKNLSLPVVNGDRHIVAEIHPLPLLSPGLLSLPLPAPVFLDRPQAALLVNRGHPLLPGLFSRPLTTPLFLDRPQTGLLVYGGRPLFPGRASVPTSSLEAEDPEVVGVVLFPVLAAALFSEAARGGVENIVLGSSPRPKQTFMHLWIVKIQHLNIFNKIVSGVNKNLC
jgi:hypothetical protein